MVYREGQCAVIWSEPDETVAPGVKGFPVGVGRDEGIRDGSRGIVDGIMDTGFDVHGRFGGNEWKVGGEVVAQVCYDVCAVNGQFPQ